MNCPRCKTVVTQQDKYCPSCGLPLEAARSGGAPAKKPGGKKAYEEASTQLVDVDEFRKYMADEKSKPATGGGHAAGVNLASGGNLAGSAPAPSRNLAMGGATEEAVRPQDRPTVPVAPPGAGAASSAPTTNSTGDHDAVSLERPGRSQTMIFVVAALVIALFALAIFKYLLA